MPTGKDILNTAIRELGTKESPANSNNVKYNTWYYGKPVGGSAYPWCMAFVQWCYDQAGARLPFKTASCGGLLRWYQRNQPECITDDPVPGSIVIFDFPGGADTDHTGLFERFDGQYITTIDGNTGTTSDANGGAVMRRTRPRRQALAYITPRGIAEKKEDESVEEKRYNTMAEISDGAPWATETVEKLIDKGIIKGGGLKDTQGRPADMDLSRDMLRLLVWNDRAGLYD